MKTLVSLVALFALSGFRIVDAAEDNAALLPSAVHEWTQLEAVARSNGFRRAVFDGRTANLENLHCHISTLHPGEVSGEPRLHENEEIIIVKEGLVEFHHDGTLENAGPGSVVFLAANAVTRLKNVGHEPATYIVIYYTPKGEAK